nr:MAG TPA: hypothetical protein [Caudoviricetes sp.]
MEYRIKRETDDELFHSDEYLGEEFDGGLYHYKYIHKYKKNGKWVYVYYQPILDADVKSANDRIALLRENAMRYNSGRYFDKDHPGTLAARRQSANYQYKRAVADNTRLAELAEENRRNEEEYNKSFQAKIDKGKEFLRRLFNL